MPNISQNVNIAKIGDNGYAKSPPTSYTTGQLTSALAASLIHQVHYNSTTDRLVVSDGTQWLNLYSAPPGTPSAVVAYPSGSRPSAASNSGVIILNSTTGNYERSNGTAWLVLGSTRRRAAEAIMGIGVVGLDSPARVSPRVAGTTVYVDPTGAAGTGASTADTRNTLPSPLVAGRQYLIKEGTTLTQSVSTSVVATATNPIVIGVYRTGSGARVNTSGAATLNGTISITNAAHVCVDALNVSANPNGGSKILVQSSPNCDITNCITSNGNGNGIRAVNSSTLTIDGCTASGNTNKDGIVIEAQDGVTVSNLTVQYCTVNNNANAGIRWAPYGGNALLANVTIARNTCNGNATGVDNYSSAVGILFQGFASDLKIYRNNCTNNGYSNIRLNWWGGGSGNFNNLLIENNTLSGSAMSIHCLGVKGNGIIQRNVIDDAGSNDGGVTPLGADQYGRAIEFFGFQDYDRCEGLTVRFNSVGRTFCFKTFLTEGIALGSDDRTAFCNFYGNWAEGAEGQMMQFNTNRAVRLFANVGWNNSLRNRQLDGHDSSFRAEIQMGSSSGCLTFGNALICGRDPVGFQLYGYAENGDTNTDCELTHNTIIGAREVGARLSGSTTTAGNHFRNNPTNKQLVSNGSSVALSAGETTSSSSATTAAAQIAESDATALYRIPFAGVLVDAPVIPPSPGSSYTTTPQTPATAVGNFANVASATVALGSATAAGNSVFCLVTCWNYQLVTETVSGVSGSGLTWTEAARSSNVSNTITYLYVAPSATSITPSVTVTFTFNTDNCYSICVWEGPALASTTPIVTTQTDTGSATYTTTSVGPTATLPTASAYAVYSAAVIPLDATQKPNLAALPASFSSLAADTCTDPDVVGMRAAEQALSATTPLTVTSTYTTSTESKISMLVMFQTVAAAGGALPPATFGNETNPKGFRNIINRLFDSHKGL